MKLSRLFLWLACLLAAVPAQAEWRRAESPNFIVYSEDSEARLRERVTMLEDFDRLLRLMTGIEAPPAPTKLSVYIVDGSRDLRLLRPVDSGIAGFYTATSSGIAAFVDGSVPTSVRGTGDRRRTDANEILFHEYAHHFMWQYAATAYPAWYVEGFAEYFMTAQFRERSIDIGNFSVGRGYALTEGSWLPTERVLTGETSGLTREQRGQFYAQSWLLTHYFFSADERQGPFRRYLAAIGAGTAPAEALQAATGFTPQQLHEALRRYIRGGRIHYRRFTFEDARTPPPPVTVTMMSPAAEDLLLYDAALRIGITDDNRQPYLERIRAAAARYADDPLATRVLAHAELLYGDRAAADRLLDGLLAAAPNDAELLYLKGLLHLTAADDGDWDREAPVARSWFTRAHRANENHFQTLYRYAQSMRTERDFVSENNRNVLLLAHQLAPQVAEIRMNAANLLIARGETDEAVVLLQPLAADPHDDGLAHAAREMIERARIQTAENGPAAPTPGE